MLLKFVTVTGTVIVPGSAPPMVAAVVTGAFWDRMTELQDKRMVNIKNKNRRVLAFSTTLLTVNEPFG